MHACSVIDKKGTWHQVQKTVHQNFHRCPDTKKEKKSGDELLELLFLRNLPPDFSTWIFAGMDVGVCIASVHLCYQIIQCHSGQRTG